ncbi:hypothetical protein Q1695_014219 [Nippostrongylus brasiliensis]|nr:hypothetical protein Q1695_014219 [Nippostrongylus brasiliensis]
MKLLLCFFLISVLIVSSHARHFSACARMDGGSLSKKAARVFCITSCHQQNCGTGYCRKVGYKKTCICDRCKNGGNVPVAPILHGRN